VRAESAASHRPGRHAQSEQPQDLATEHEQKETGDPKAKQWSLNYASLAGGILTAPVFGALDSSGRGTFIGQDQLGGRTILVRFIITRPSAGTARFEQSYSADGGSRWETNWIALDIMSCPALSVRRPLATAAEMASTSS
jgi:hypothetical protein